MVDVSSTPMSANLEFDSNKLEGFIPEQEQDENLERLRNIRDMFENSGNDSSNELILQKVEKLQPSEKIKERFANNNKCDSFENNNSNANLFGLNTNMYATHAQNGQSEDSISPEEEEDDDDDDDVDEEETSDPLCLTNEQLITNSPTITSDNITDTQYFLSNQTSTSTTQSQYKGGLSTATQSIIDTMDKSNFILKEQQQRSINGDPPSLIDTTNTPSPSNSTISSSNHTNSKSNNLNILSSGSSSISSSMSSPVIPSNSEQNNVEANEEEEEAEERNNLMHVDYFDSNKLIDFEERFEEGAVNDEANEEGEEADEEGSSNDGSVVKSTPRTKKNKDIIAFAEMSNVKEKFERRGSDVTENHEMKPMRSITPPREGANRVEIENEPAQRPADVVSNFEKVEDVLPSEGYIRSRKEMFSGSTETSQSSPAGLPKIKAITPPREDMIKRTLKEKTPERNENVIRESDKTDEYVPEAGHAKQTAAIFTGSGERGTRLRSIERSGITIEGELAEKGIAKSRLALFNDPNAQFQTSTVSTAELESEIIKNASGIAKERLNLFKNLEKQDGTVRTSPSREFKKLKEFTPPPQLDPHLQRQYIIIDKDNNATNNPSDNDIVKESNVKEEFLPESGLAKSRMKQYLESTSNNQPQHASGNDEATEEATKGLAKSLLAKWKSMENVKDKETSPEPSGAHQAKSKHHKERQTTPGGTVIVNSNEGSDDDYLPQSGTAKSLLNKWQNIDSNSSANKERKAPRAFTPPPPEEIQRNKERNQDENDSPAVKSNVDEELALLRGQAKNTLAKFEQSLIESNSNVRRTVTPPREYLKNATGVKSVFESQPVESNINAVYCEEEVIPSAGHAKSLKTKFLTLEKEAAKVETSSSKMNYVPKKFTSATAPATAQKQIENTPPVSKPTAPPPKQSISNGLLTPAVNLNQSNSSSATNNTEKCCVCEKTVYAMEKIEADKKVYHKLCFKCTSCNCTLKLGNYSSIKQTLYCTPHYIQLFARNGNYDEGFGLENYKRKWLQRSPSESTMPTATN